MVEDRVGQMNCLHIILQNSKMTTETRVYCHGKCQNVLITKGELAKKEVLQGLHGRQRNKRGFWVMRKMREWLWPGDSRSSQGSGPCRTGREKLKVDSHRYVKPSFD